MKLAMEKCRFFPPSFATTIVKIDFNLHDGRAADKGRKLKPVGNASPNGIE